MEHETDTETLEQVPPRYPTVAEAIEDWRNEEPLISQEQIARLADVSLNTSRRWVRGESCPDVPQFRALEAARPGLLRRLFGAALAAG